MTFGWTIHLNSIKISFRFYLAHILSFLNVKSILLIVIIQNDEFFLYNYQFEFNNGLNLLFNLK
jgi:hypothetical protein